MKYLLFIFTLIISQSSFGQKAKVPTIPLEKKIDIVITEIDTNLLHYYNIYKFDYKNLNAEFWALKSDTTFIIGKTKAKLCRIIQMKTENLNLRGGAFYNGYTISDGDSIKRQFVFDEYGEFPTLRLCSSEY